MTIMMHRVAYISHELGSSQAEQEMSSRDTQMPFDAFQYLRRKRGHQQGNIATLESRDMQCSAEVRRSHLKLFEVNLA